METEEDRRRRAHDELFEPMVAFVAPTIADAINAAIAENKRCDLSRFAEQLMRGAAFWAAAAVNDAAARYLLQQPGRGCLVVSQDRAGEAGEVIPADAEEE